MEVPDAFRYFAFLFILSSTLSLSGQSSDIGLISVDSIVENSLIGDSSVTFIEKTLIKEQKIFRDSFERFEKEYSKLLEESRRVVIAPKPWNKKIESIQHMNQRLTCMEHLATSIELLYEEELRYFISDELRRHTPKVKELAQVSVIVTHRPLFSASENMKEEFFFVPLNQLFINAVQNSTPFRQRWSAFRKQMIVKIAALKVNMYQHCFNN